MCLRLARGDDVEAGLAEPKVQDHGRQKILAAERTQGSTGWAEEGAQGDWPRPHYTSGTVLRHFQGE